MRDTLVPQHSVKADSPIYAAMFALFTAYDLPFAAFNQNVNYWRRKLAFDLVSDRLHDVQLEKNVNQFVHSFLCVLPLFRQPGMHHLLTLVKKRRQLRIF